MGDRRQLLEPLYLFFIFINAKFQEFRDLIIRHISSQKCIFVVIVIECGLNLVVEEAGGQSLASDECFYEIEVVRKLLV